MKALFEDIQSSLIQILDKATASIEIAVAWFTNAALMECILKKLSQGVKVTLILNNDPINNNNQNCRYLERLLSNGCIIHWIDYPELMHQKFCIIDNKIVANGSYNWTFYAENHNRENLVIIDDVSVVEAFHDEFTKMCSIYPLSDEIPRPGGSGLTKTVIDNYRTRDQHFSSSYYNDIPKYSIKTEWKSSSILRVFAKSKRTFSLIIKWTQDDTEIVLNANIQDNEYVCEYDESCGFGYANKTGKEYFKLFVMHNEDTITYEICDGEKNVCQCVNNAIPSSNEAILLYTSYSIDSTNNEHIKYQFDKFKIPIKIKVFSDNDILDCSIESMLGILESIDVHRENRSLEIRHNCVPDRRRYYLVLKSKADVLCNVVIEYLRKKEELQFKLCEKKTYYVGHFCNTSARYDTKKIYYQSGINR